MAPARSGASRSDPAARSLVVRAADATGLGPHSVSERILRSSTSVDVRQLFLSPDTLVPDRGLPARSDRSYIVLEGGLEMQTDQGRHVLAPGDAAFVPFGVSHTALSISQGRSIVLVVHSPMPEDQR